MIFYFMMFLILMSLISMINIMLHYSSLLLTLMSFEALILSLMMLMIITMLELNMLSNLCVIIMLGVSVCEASLGLSILVIMSRNFGNDKLKSLSLLKC